MKRAGSTSATRCICAGWWKFRTICARQCAYCGLRAGNLTLDRYRMLTPMKLFDAAQQAVKFGYGTVVLQAGEDYGITAEWMAESSGRSRPRRRWR